MKPRVILNPPRMTSEEELTPEPSDIGGDDAEGEEEMDMDSDAPVGQRIVCPAYIPGDGSSFWNGL